jgi:hypothetical protein
MLHYNPLLSSGTPYGRVQRVTIPDAVIIQFVLLKTGMLMLETCKKIKFFLLFVKIMYDCPKHTSGNEVLEVLYIMVLKTI